MRVTLAAIAALGVCSVAIAAPWDEKTPEIGTVGMPSGPVAVDEFEELLAVGEALFEVSFTTLDGAGRPMATQAIIPTKPRRPLRQDFARTSGPDAHSCGACHNQPIVGGAGDFVTNVFVSEGFTSHDFDTTDPEFSNERGTNHLFGAGLIELLAREMTADLHAIRKTALRQAREAGKSVTAKLITKDVSFGEISAHADGIVDLSQIAGVDSDLVIRPFSQKGVMTSLRQFTVNAANHHHGMQSSERFGARWTGEADFDEDGFEAELSEGDVSALVAWQASLPAPLIASDLETGWAEAAQRGASHFEELGCGGCHRASLPLESLLFADPGPFDSAGTLNTASVSSPGIYDLGALDWAKSLPRDSDGRVLVPLFGDLKRHKMSDQEVDRLGNELLSQRFVDRTVFITAELWGIADTAPYGHRNDITTLHEMIAAHGGDARATRDAYLEAPRELQSDIIAFLKSLEVSQ